MIASVDIFDMPSQKQSPENGREEANSSQQGLDNSKAQSDEENMLRAAGTGLDRPPSLRPALEMPALLVEMPRPSRLNNTGWQHAAQDLGLPVSSSVPERYSQMPSTSVS